MPVKDSAGAGRRNNSSWNIATDLMIDLSFHQEEIAGMLEEYEQEHHTGMNVQMMAELLYEYTSGYPYLVSRLCKLIEERICDFPEFSTKTDA